LSPKHARNIPVADLVGQFRRGGAGRQERNAGLLGERAERLHRIGIGIGDDGRRVLRDQNLALGGDGRRIGLGVDDDELELPAEHAAGGVDLLRLQLRAVDRRDVERGEIAGQVGRHGDADRLVGGEGRQGNETEKRQSDHGKETLAHRVGSSSLARLRSRRNVARGLAHCEKMARPARPSG
jgi:hypothetical protein